MTALVAQGDITTTRGEVLSGSSTQYDEDGRSLALDLDYATCGICKDGGPWRILGSVADWTDEGRKMVKDLDLVHCPCKKNRVLAKRQDYLVEQRGGTTTRTHAASSTATSVRSYDEQIRIVDTSGFPVVNCPYHITDSTGKTYQGLTDESGRCPRVFTVDQKTLDIAVGVRALERWTE